MGDVMLKLSGTHMRVWTWAPHMAPHRPSTVHTDYTQTMTIAEIGPSAFWSQCERPVDPPPYTHRRTASHPCASPLHPRTHDRRAGVDSSTGGRVQFATIRADAYASDLSPCSVLARDGWVSLRRTDMGGSYHSH